VFPDRDDAFPADSLRGDFRIDRPAITLPNNHLTLPGPEM